MRKWICCLVLAVLGACTSDQLSISEDAGGTRVQIINQDGREVLGRLEFGQTKVIEEDGLRTYENNGNTSSQIILTANGFRLSDGCPLGSTTFTTTVNSGDGLTGAKADSWQISSFFSSSPTIGQHGECLAR